MSYSTVLHVSIHTNHNQVLLTTTIYHHHHHRLHHHHHHIIVVVVVIIIIIIIGSTALGGPWPPQANAASDLYSGHPPISFYNPISLRLPLPRQSILISVGHVLTTIYK